MADKADFQIVHEALIAFSSCDFIKGVSAASAAVSAAGYYFTPHVRCVAREFSYRLISHFMQAGCQEA
jgi:hypothetical protein